MYTILIDAIATAKTEQKEGSVDARRMAVIITKLEEAYAMYGLATNSFRESILDEDVEDRIAKMNGVK